MNKYVLIIVIMLLTSACYAQDGKYAIAIGEVGYWEQISEQSSFYRKTAPNLFKIDTSTGQVWKWVEYKSADGSGWGKWQEVKDYGKEPPVLKDALSLNKRP